MTEELLLDIKLIMLNKYQNHLKSIIDEFIDKKDFDDFKIKITDLISNWNTARLDIKNKGNEHNSIKILNHDKENTEILTPGWFKDKTGEGITIHSTNHTIQLELECINDGNILFRFMGPDLKYSDDRIPIYINYSNILINDIPYFNKNLLVWHNSNEKIIEKCKNNEKFSLKIQYETIFDYFPELKTLSEKMINKQYIKEVYHEITEYLKQKKQDLFSNDSRIKIGILGSCVSRSIFRRLYNPSYKEHINLALSYERMSLISLMQVPIPFSDKELEIIPVDYRNKFRMDIMKKDLSKQFFKDLKKYPVDYLIIDVFFEIYFGIYVYENNYITGNYWDYPDTDFFNKDENIKHLTMENDFEEYFTIWKTNCDKFFKYMNENYPDTKIILNKVLCSDIIKKDNGVRYVHKGYNKDKKRYNPLFKHLEEYIENNFNVIVLDVTDDLYLTDNHIFDLFHVHYHNEVNNRMYDDLLKIIFKYS